MGGRTGIRAGAFAALLLAACGGSQPTSQAKESSSPTAAAAAAVSRQEVNSCLDRAGLAPEDTGVFIVGSAGTDVEAIGVKLDKAGRTLIFVFNKDAASYVDYVRDNSAKGYADISARGNVIVAFESTPPSSERGKIDSCVAG
jgi:hypothetical protein